MHKLEVTLNQYVNGLITSEQQKRDTGWKNDLGIIFEELVRRLLVRTNVMNGRAICGGKGSRKGFWPREAQIKAFWRNYQTHMYIMGDKSLEGSSETAEEKEKRKDQWQSISLDSAHFSFT